MKSEDSHSPPRSHLNDISTIQQLPPHQQVVRYAVAVRSYLLAIFHGDEDAASAVYTEIVKKFLEGKLAGWSGSGRFRDFMKRVVRNAAIDYIRSQAGRQKQHAGTVSIDKVAELEDASHEDLWPEKLGLNIYSNALKALYLYQKKHEKEGNVFFTIVQIHTGEAGAEHTEIDQGKKVSAKQLATALTHLTGHDYTAGNARKQKERARAKLLKLIAEEVQGTLDEPTPESVEEECALLAVDGMVERLLGDGVMDED